MEIDEIKSLADKARIDMTEEEVSELGADFEKILEYVSLVNKADVEKVVDTDFAHKNIFREDVATNENGVFSDDLINEMPDSEDGYLKVKKIL